MFSKVSSPLYGSIQSSTTIRRCILTQFHHGDVGGFVVPAISPGNIHECTPSPVINLLLVSLDEVSIYTPLVTCPEVDREASCAESSKQAVNVRAILEAVLLALRTR